jgi:hypothetical protein
MQDLTSIELLCKKGYDLWMNEFGEHCNISPSLHRLLQHSTLYMRHYQDQGYALGEMSEKVQEASNFDSARD